MTYEEYRALWVSLTEAQKERVRNKCRWEHMTLWAVCEEWPGIWDRPRHRGGGDDAMSDEMPSEVDVTGGGM